jgi:ABC-type multidrug transport system, ATPase and permease components
MGDIRRLLGFVKPYKRIAIISLVFLVGMVAFDLAIPRLVGLVIDEGIRKKDASVVLWTSAAMLCASALSALCAVLNSNTSIRVGESVARDLREALFVKIQGFSFSDMDEYSTGRLMVRLASDTGAAQRLVQVSLRIGTRAPLSMIGSLVLMFATDRALALSMLPFVLVAAAVIVLFSSRMEPLFRSVQRRLDRLNTVLQENIAGARLVKAFVRAGHEAERFGEANEEYAGDTVKVMQFMSAMTPALTLFINAAVVLVVWLGGARAMDGRLTLGHIVAFTNYLLATMNPLIMMTQLSNTWANGLASMKRIDEVLDRQDALRDPVSPRPLPKATGYSVRFDRVTFRYDTEPGRADLEGPAALEDVSFAAEAGQTVAVLGATGSGKTTLACLIPRFYDATEGRVLIEGIDVRDMSEAERLSRIAVVPQETVLFAGTIRDNIRYGRPESSEDEIVRAAEAAQAMEFIRGLPGGLDARVEERGRNLSGGQRQRVAIARAIAARPAILILDDSTSAVDVRTETLIQDALAEVAKDCTCFVVAQRVSTVLNADKILVLDSGRLVAEGTHAELLGSSVVYKEIYDSQLGGSRYA